jgi:hypothetical protein
LAFFCFVLAPFFFPQKGILDRKLKFGKFFFAKWRKFSYKRKRCKSAGQFTNGDGVALKRTQGFAA